MTQSSSLETDNCFLGATWERANRNTNCSLHNHEFTHSWSHILRAAPWWLHIRLHTVSPNIKPLSSVETHMKSYRREASQVSLWQFYSAYIFLSFKAYDNSYSESRTEMTFNTRGLVKPFQNAPAEYFSSYALRHWEFLEHTYCQKYWVAPF